MEAALRSDFRAGLDPNRPAAWIDDPVDQANDGADIGCEGTFLRCAGSFTHPIHHLEKAT